MDGRPDGTLKWKGNDIVRSVNNVAADVNGNVNITSVVEGITGNYLRKDGDTLVGRIKSTVENTIVGKDDCTGRIFICSGNDTSKDERNNPKNEHFKYGAYIALAGESFNPTDSTITPR